MNGTQRSHIAVFNVPQHGRVNPTLGVVRELVRRGHRVSYATNQALAAKVAEAGAEPVVVDGMLAEEHAAPEAVADASALALDDARRTLPLLADVFERDRPDLVLYETQAWAGSVLAGRWGVPAIQLTCTHAYYEGWAEDLFGTPDLSTLPLFAQFAAFVAEFSPHTSVFEFVFPAHHRSLVFIPRTFQRRAETVGDRHLFVGPVVEGRSLEGSWAPPDTERPVLLIALGSLFTGRPGFYAACMDAFAELDWHVVMAVGHQIDLADLPQAPPNFEVHRSVPQLQVLAQASAFVTHAGMGSVLEALHYGVPMVAVPQMAEQRVNADQIASLRLGRHLPRDDADASALREAVLEVVDDPAIIESVRAMQADITRSGGAVAAADHIEAGLPAA